MDEGQRRVLRPMITTKEVSVEEGVIMPKTFPKKSREETQLIEMAHRLGYAVTPISKSRQELARAIASRMVNRKGDFVYQSAAVSITNFPLSALESIFPDDLLTNDPDAPKTWSLPSVGCVSTILCVRRLQDDIRDNANKQHNGARLQQCQHHLLKTDRPALFPSWTNSLCTSPARSGRPDATRREYWRTTLEPRAPPSMQ